MALSTKMISPKLRRWKASYCDLMWGIVRARSLLPSFSSASSYPWKLGLSPYFSSSPIHLAPEGLLELEEVEKILTDVRADNVKVLPVGNSCEWADYMVIASGSSTWHVKNIAQALIYKAKQKQKGARRLILPSVEGQEGGKWIVVDSGKVIVHALDEKARAYYNLETLWTSQMSQNESNDLGNALVKIRKKNNSKKPVQQSK